MLFQELIRTKRDGGVLNSTEIAELVAAMVDGRISDEQLGAFAMAVYWRGMSAKETTALTQAMRDSGRVMDWHSELSGPVLDKHSTGGIGDATSLLVGPWVAACGGHVPMISGRGLGHTGGTLDKLSAIPGYDPFPDPTLFQRTVREVGVAIIGQTDDLAPADRRFYAIRDVTATVDCLPLIVASILGKKLAEGLDGLVLDVKTGSGAVMPTVARAAELAEKLVDVARQSGVPAEALLTAMDRPLATTAGNALEVAEVIALLNGNRQGGHLFELSRVLSARLLLLGRLATSEQDAFDRLDQVWHAGEVAERFARMNKRLGGPGDLLARPSRHLAAAPIVTPIFPEQAGWVLSMDMRAIGLAVVALGGGRRRAADTIDPAVGLSELVEPGQPVGPDRPLALVHARSQDQADQAALALQAAIAVVDTQAELMPPSPLVSRLVAARPKVY